MKLIQTELEGVFIIENFHAADHRGSFTKTFHQPTFEANGLCTDFKESYFSVSKKNVIRGMHFQLPPHDHEKLVYVAKGQVLDVIFDMRKDSSTFGQSISVVLNDENHRSVYIPKGLAHGFKSMLDDTIMVYNVATVYNGEADYGIRYSSIDFEWNDEAAIISDRDKLLSTFDEFRMSNPF